MEKDQKKTSRARSISVEYVSAASGFIVLAWVGDVPMVLVATVVAFLLTGGVARVLFDQLSGTSTILVSVWASPWLPLPECPPH
ncbi:MAG: hypothetical protein OXH52_16465 [Gammaproteobacteria bacterium]|nr:hypothetical protein [Gammaproteobacteria bacterium]